MVSEKEEVGSVLVEEKKPSAPSKKKKKKFRLEWVFCLIVVILPRSEERRVGKECRL